MHISVKYSINIFFFTLLLLFSCKEKDKPEPAPSLTDLQHEAFDLVNEHRMSRGLDALKPNETCQQLASRHSSNMAEGSVAFSHDGFDDRFAEAQETIGALSAAENVAFNYRSAEALVEAWLLSEVHLENIEGDYSHSGLSVAEDDKGQWYFTQFFVKR